MVRGVSPWLAVAVLRAVGPVWVTSCRRSGSPSVVARWPADLGGRSGGHRTRRAVPAAHPAPCHMGKCPTRCHPERPARDAQEADGWGIGRITRSELRRGC